VRARIGEGAIISKSIIMGNDRFQTLKEIVSHPERIPLGVGDNTIIERAIIDKDCAIGKNVIIRGGDNLQNMEDENYCIVEGIVVLKKGAIIQDGARIGES
jgi:glucose-1-phosphate adenylyltransferase